MGHFVSKKKVDKVYGSMIGNSKKESKWKCKNGGDGLGKTNPTDDPSTLRGRVGESTKPKFIGLFIRFG